MRLLALTAVAAMAIAAPAMAQSSDDGASSSNWYVSGGYSHFVDGSNDEVGGATVRVANRFTPNIGVEVEGSVGVTSADVGGFDFKINNNVGVYLVGYLRAEGSNLEMFGRLGYARTDFDIAGSSLTDGGFSGGVGAQYFFEGGDNGIRFDITNQQFSDLDADWDAFSVTYVRRF